MVLPVKLQEDEMEGEELGGYVERQASALECPGALDCWAELNNPTALLIF